MIDRILLQDKYFISKYHIEEIKGIIKPSISLKHVVQMFCLLTGIKPLRKGLPNGTVQIDYYQPFLQLVKTNKLVSFINSFNKLTVKGDCLQ